MAEKKMNNFCIFQKYFSCCSITDCTVESPQGYNKKDKVAIKTKAGNQLISHERQVKKNELNLYCCRSNSSFVFK